MPMFICGYLLIGAMSWCAVELRESINALHEQRLRKPFLPPPQAAKVVALWPFYVAALLP